MLKQLVALTLLALMLTSPELAFGNPQLFNTIGVGQGVAAPSTTNLLNFSNGFTSENPAGAIYQGQLRLTGQYHQSSPEGYGGEIGYGRGGGFGLALGGRQACDACESQASGALAVGIDQVALGVRIEDGLVGAGFILNPIGRHRFAMMAEFDQDGDQSDFAAGYVFFNGNYSLGVDGSMRSISVNGQDQQWWTVSPSFAFYVKRVNFSLTYDMNSSDGTWNEPNQLWAGLGFGTPGSWHFNIYNSYYSDWAAALSFFF